MTDLSSHPICVSLSQYGPPTCLWRQGRARYRRKTWVFFLTRVLHAAHPVSIFSAPLIFQEIHGGFHLRGSQQLVDPGTWIVGGLQVEYSRQVADVRTWTVRFMKERSTACVPLEVVVVQIGR
jgi:hypothetical protein